MNDFINLKICGTCSEEKPFNAFASKNGKPASKCKDCHNKYQKEYYQRNPEKYEALKSQTRKNGFRYSNREAARAKLYGLSHAEYSELKLSNNGLCHLCNQKKATCVDHDHQTGRVRGHLCAGCNTGLGKLGDSVAGLQKAIDYLERNIDS